MQVRLNIYNSKWAKEWVKKTGLSSAFVVNTAMAQGTVQAETVLAPHVKKKAN